MYNSKSCKYCQDVSKKEALALMDFSCDIAIENFLKDKYPKDVILAGKKRYLDDLKKGCNKHQIHCYIHGHSSSNHAYEIERRFKRYYNTNTEQWVDV